MELIKIDNDVTMTTLEIAEQTGKEHKNVLRDAKAMLLEIYGEEGLLKFEQTYTHPQNKQSYPCYRLPKKEILVLISGYSIKLRMAIITRLEELEKRAKDPMVALNDPAAMRHILLAYTERVIALEETVKEQAPKAAALDRIATADGSMCITAAAKHLQIRPKDLFDWLSANKWIYRRHGSKNCLGYQDRIQQGLMEHKVNIQVFGDGTEKIYEQARVTPKGLAKLSKALECNMA